jgi:streptogramin lyase
MFKKIAFIVFHFFFFISISQNNLQWKGYFSYNNIEDLSEAANTVFAGSENALFTKKLNTQELKTINSIDGLKTDIISAIYYSQQKNLTFIGNKSGLLLLIKSDGTVVSKRGIIDELQVSPFLKNINHFYEFQDKVYLSCDYGISVFDLNTLEFGDTYFIGNGGANEKIFQTTIFNDEIYAVTTYSGIKKASVTNPNLVDFNQWQTVSSGYWQGVVTFQNQLLFLSSDNQVYKYDGVFFTPFTNLNQQGVDFRENGNYLIATTAVRVKVYDQDLMQVAIIQSNQFAGFTGSFTCATVINNKIFIGTNTDGMIEVDLGNPLNFQFVKPDGPLLNNIFRIKKSSTKLWTLYGKYDRLYNPYNPNPPYVPFQYPISYFSSENGWDFIPFNELFDARSLSDISFNPSNDEELYISSFYSGLLKIVDKIPVQIYNATNTGPNGLQSIPGQVPNDVRINGPAIDKNGNIWVTNSLVNNGLAVLRTSGSWQSYDFTNIIPNANTNSYGSLIVDRNDTKWIPSINGSLIAFNETVNKTMVIKTGTEGNLPDSDVRCVKLDNRNQLWIGTAKGLRIIQNISQFLTQDQIQTRDIIILEDGLAQELFYNQFILDIEVDGANRKWVSIANSGVYLISSNGQETIFHFTTQNSPLPSNMVNDIEIDQVTGEVFFATENGMISFKGTSTSPKDNLSQVYVYPNPVRPEFTGTIKIASLTDKAIVKITDIEGNLVFETTSSGGTIEWDTTAFGKYKVASGVYMIFISAEDGIETTVKKVMIIR